MLQYLDSVAARGMSLVECLSFLFQLSFSQLGKVGARHACKPYILYIINVQYLEKAPPRAVS